PLAKLTQSYVRESPSQLDEEAPQALGTLATAGFLVLLLIALAAMVPGVKVAVPNGLLRAAAAATVVATLIGLTGGFSGVVSYLISHTIRSWNRYSIFIGFLALLPLGVALARAPVALRRRGLGRVPLAVALAALVVLGTLDQTGKTIVPPYKALSAKWNGEADFVHALES